MRLLGLALLAVVLMVPVVNVAPTAHLSETIVISTALAPTVAVLAITFALAAACWIGNTNRFIPHFRGGRHFFAFANGADSTGTTSTGETGTKTTNDRGGRLPRTPRRTPGIFPGVGMTHRTSRTIAMIVHGKNQ